MSPDHVCEMCREPFLSRRIRGFVSTARVAPSFSHTYLWKGEEVRKFPGWATPKPPCGVYVPKAGGRLLHVLPVGLGLWAGSRAWEEDVPWGEPGGQSVLCRSWGRERSSSRPLLVIYTLGSDLGQNVVTFGQKPSPNSHWERASRRNSSEDVKRLHLAKESNFLSGLHFGTRSMRGIVRSMHHGDKLTLVSKKISL